MRWLCIPFFTCRKGLVFLLVVCLQRTLISRGMVHMIRCFLCTANLKCLSVFDQSICKPHRQTQMPSKRGKWIPKFTRMCYQITSGYLSVNWSLQGIGWCSRTMTLSMAINPPQNGFRKKKKRKSVLWSSPVRAQTLTPTEWPKESISHQTFY